MVALGAVLIWFGLSQGGSGTVAAGERGGEVAPAVGDVAPVALASGRGTGGPAPGPTMRRAPEPDLEEAARIAQEQREALRIQQQETLRMKEEAREREEELARQRLAAEAAEAAEAAARDDAIPAADLATNDDGGFGFASSGPGTDRVAELLLDAWLAGDPNELSVYLEQGEGADLPEPQRRLIAAFWQALGPQVEGARATLAQVRGQRGVTSGQLGLLDAALDPPRSRVVPRAASSSRPEPLAHAMRMVLLGDEAASLLDAREYARSAVAWSELIKLEIEADWAPHRGALLGWAKQLEQAQANHRFSARGEWPSIEVTVKPGESLTKIRKRVMRARSGFTICTGLIEASNGINGYIHPGDVLRIPTEPANCVVDLEARLVMYRHGDEVVRAWECGIGKPGHETPIGEYTVGVKQEKPAHTTWNLPYGHPDNPLGSHWLTLERDGKNTSYGIHGTNDPEGVGGEVSLGCVRMRNEDVGELFRLLPQGAQVILQ